MRNIKLIAAVAAVALILGGIAGWANSNNHAFEAKASTAAAQLDTFTIMVNAKNLPNQEFEDFSVVFSSPLANGQTSITP
jgi:predicted negative regulator of RcsB-dependent stress response